jgi:hypothetical protein
MFNLHWKPRIIAYAYAEDEPVAARDAGWVELWSADGERHYGRGHLMLWSAEPAEGETAGNVEVDNDAAQPVGEGGPNLRAELRGFTFDGDPPGIGAALLVRPETEQESYSVCVLGIEHEEPNGRISLDWPDDRLPASLSELGGY